MRSETTEIPEGLHEREYAVKILEDILGFGRKWNIETMIECLISLGKARGLKPHQCFIYMARAIRIGQAQGEEVDMNWFTRGRYMLMRPDKQFRGTFKPVPPEEKKAATESNKSYFESQEYKDWAAKMKAKHGL